MKVPSEPKLVSDRFPANKAPDCHPATPSLSKLSFSLLPCPPFSHTSCPPFSHTTCSYFFQEKNLEVNSYARDVLKILAILTDDSWYGSLHVKASIWIPVKKKTDLRIITFKPEALFTSLQRKLPIVPASPPQFSITSLKQPA